MMDIVNRVKRIARRMPFVDYLFDLVNSILTLSETGGTFTSDGNENTVYIENSPLGIFKARQFVVNFDNMVGGDTMVIRVYYRIKSGGNLELHSYTSYTGADGGLTNSRKLDDIQLLDNRFGIKITEERTAGADHDFDWEFTSEA